MMMAGCASTLHVANGEPFTTGNASFDDFFTAVRAVRAEARAAPRDEDAAHAGLIAALGLSPRAGTERTLEEAGARARKLKERGILLHLEIAPEPRFVALRGKAALGPEGEALLKAMESATQASLEMRKHLAAVATRAAELEKRRADLRSQAPTAFRDEPVLKHAEIMAELDGARAVLADAGEGATRASGAAARFVVDLVQVVETGALDPNRMASSPTKKGWAPKAAPAALPPKKKGSDDFEP